MVKIHHSSSSNFVIRLIQTAVILTLLPSLYPRPAYRNNHSKQKIICLNTHFCIPGDSFHLPYLSRRAYWVGYRSIFYYRSTRFSGSFLRVKEDTVIIDMNGLLKQLFKYHVFIKQTSLSLMFKVDELEHQMIHQDVPLQTHL